MTVDVASTLFVERSTHVDVSGVVRRTVTGAGMTYTRVSAVWGTTVFPVAVRQTEPSNVNTSEVPANNVDGTMITDSHAASDSA